MDIPSVALMKRGGGGGWSSGVPPELIRGASGSRTDPYISYMDLSHLPAPSGIEVRVYYINAHMVIVDINSINISIVLNG